MTGKTVYGEENGQRLLAFSKSIYSDGKLQDQARSWVHNRREEKFGKLGELKRMKKKFARHRFIQKKRSKMRYLLVTQARERQASGRVYETNQ